MPKKHRITKLSLDEISIVDTPADPNALVTIFKRGTPEKETAGMDDIRKMTEQMEKATATIGELTKRAETAEAELAKRDARVTELEAAVEKAGQPKLEGEEAILKSITDPGAREAFVALRKKADAATEALAKMADEADVRKAVSQVAADYSNLPIKADDFGPVFKRLMGAVSEADATELRRVLKAADSFAAAAMRATPGGRVMKVGSAEQEIEAKAQELSKGGTMTYSAAYQKVCEMHPELYARYNSETGQGH